jgi:hypothetical protein
MMERSILRRGSLAPHHFDEMLNFHSVEEDKITGRLHTKGMRRVFKSRVGFLKSTTLV